MGTISPVPIVASILLYYSWKPQTLVNYAELLKTTPKTDDKAFRFEALRGKWVFLRADSGGWRQKSD